MKKDPPPGNKKRSSRIRKVITGITIALVALASLYGALYLLTPYSELARAVIWMDADIKDYEKFPARTINNAPPVFNFEKVDSATQSQYLRMLDGVAASSSSSQPPSSSSNGTAAAATTTQTSFNQFLASTQTTDFLIIKDDRLIYENYFNGYERDSINTSFSVAKSFVSALVGIAIDEGLIDSVDDPVTKYIPELQDKDSRYSAITVKHLLSMASGLRYVEEETPFSDDTKTYYDPNLRAVALSAVIEEEPGRRFHYNNYNYLLLGIILERATGMSVAKYMEEKLWKPLGMEAPASWSLDSEANGFEKMESGINARAIDFAKFGRLYLNNGSNWDGEQIISEKWVSTSTSANSTSDPSIAYQYGWWIYPLQDGSIDNKRHFSARGNLGQFIYVAPEQGLIIVRHGYDFGDVNWINLFGIIAATAR
ncbi:MAG: beta-lactamase family protein [Thermoproteota archaeon]|nr:beta-lactamase family protein [Thermoproteota archaeon]